MRRATAWILALVGCGGPGASPSCEDQREALSSGFAALDYSCEAPADCVMVAEPEYYCEGAPTPFDCAGIAVNRAAFQASDLADKLFLYLSCSADYETIPDCDPVAATCRAGRCATELTGICLPPPIDAGPVDAGADATPD